MINTLLFVGGNIFVYMGILFAVSVLLKRNDIADVAWGGGFLIILLSLLSLEDSISMREYIVSAMVILWAVRLILHIGLRKLKEKSEDRRYAVWRETWSMFYARSFLQVWLLHCLLYTSPSPRDLSTSRMPSSA